MRLSRPSGPKAEASGHGAYPASSGAREGSPPLMRLRAAATDAGGIDPRVALDDAMRSAVKRGLRITANRRRVLQCILDSKRPVSAYALLRLLRAERPSTAPLSVYRALDFLFHQGFIRRIELLNAYVARRDRRHERGRQFLVCAVCRGIEEIGDVAIADRLRRIARRSSFRIDRQVVELSGTCVRCQEMMQSP
jgi:Fur family transcriptional regulator, zinc uptake regulator